jgi:hypothetical protein
MLAVTYEVAVDMEHCSLKAIHARGGELRSRAQRRVPNAGGSKGLVKWIAAPRRYCRHVTA